MIFYGKAFFLMLVFETVLYDELALTVGVWLPRPTPIVTAAAQVNNTVRNALVIFIHNLLLVL